jgi:hypothetical protein
MAASSEEQSTREPVATTSEERRFDCIGGTGSGGTGEYVFQLWSSKDGEEIQAGDDVFVSLRSDKDTGKAKVLQVIDDPQHKHHGRIKVTAVDSLQNSGERQTLQHRGISQPSIVCLWWCRCITMMGRGTTIAVQHG